MTPSQHKTFHDAARRAEPDNIRIVQSVGAMLMRNETTRAADMLRELFQRFLIEADDGDEEARARAYNFFLLLGLRSLEVWTAEVEEKFFRLRGGFFNDLAAEAMNSLAPDPAPTTMSVHELLRQLA